MQLPSFGLGDILIFIGVILLVADPEKISTVTYKVAHLLGFHRGGSK